ncbi:MAG: HEPN domain-containing protein [Clostridiales bacterium]|nr:HEPN domain-containing protein [Clostridiales bacterium]
MNDKVKYWLEIAEYDLDTAKAMLSTERYLYVGFMCHQVVEKSIKAVIASLGEFPPKIHELSILADKAGIADKISQQQTIFIAKLTPLNIEARYPRYKQQISATLTETSCKLLINETEGFYKWIKTYLNQGENLHPKSEKN